MIENEYDRLKAKTNKTVLLWGNSRGIAPDSVADKMDEAMLKWLSELTDALQIWIDKGFGLTDGELILARANMGAIVESWLKFFYCVYYEEYQLDPVKYGRNRMIQPNECTFNQLEEYSKGKLWEEDDELSHWINKIRNYRNAIHSFNYREIGTAEDFVNDISKLNSFIDKVEKQLPPLEDFLD